MILFKPDHVSPIAEGRKTETRRGGKKRWNVGAVHQCRTRMMDGASTFAWVRILSVERERLGEITVVGANAEGYDSIFDYLAAWARINGRSDLAEEVWVVKFKLERVA